jgi:ectoine hydroxylase-related dioxygenase (phytanoyl-CoA dioxygenase family)
VNRAASLVMMTRISEREAAFFAANGYLPVRGVIEPAGVDALRQALTQALAEAVDHQGLYGAAPEGRVIVSRSLTDAGKVNLVLRDLHLAYPVFAEHALNPVIAAAAAALLATDQVRVLMDEAFIKEPERSGRIIWHQDSTAWRLAPPAQISCWLALDPVTKAGSAMQYVPESHRWGEYALIHSMSGRKSRADSRPVIPEDPEAAGHRVVVVDLEPGDCVFHHGLTWHASAANTAAWTRRALVTRYMARGVRFVTGAGGEAPSTAGGDEMAAWGERFPIAWPRPLKGEVGS